MPDTGPPPLLRSQIPASAPQTQNLQFPHPTLKHLRNLSRQPLRPPRRLPEKIVLLNRSVPLCFIVVKPFRLPVAAVGEFVGCQSECEVAVAPAGVRGGGGEVVDVVVRHGWIFGFVGFEGKSGAVGEN